MRCGCEQRDVARDPWATAAAADAHAYRLADVANRTRPPHAFAKASKEAAEAFDVAADAWEEVGDETKAEIRRSSARGQYIEAFLATRPHLSYGYYLVGDAEARMLAAVVGVKPPSQHKFIVTRLSRVGPEIELHRLHLSEYERERFNRRRPWAYAVTGVRVTGVRR